MDLAGATRIRDHLDYNQRGWVHPAALDQRMGLPTLCVPCRVLREVRAAWSPASLTFLELVLWVGAPTPPLPQRVIGPLPPRHLSQLKDIQLVWLQTASAAHLYTLMPHSIPFLALMPHTGWQDLLVHGEGEELQWARVYSGPTRDLGGSSVEP
ncbi:unnamed protein product [Caretta caretta]